MAKNILAPLAIPAAASAVDAGSQKKIHGSGTTAFIISNEGMNDFMKIVQALENSNFLLKRVTKTIKNETKEQKGGFLSTLLGTLGANLLGNMLAGKGTVRAACGKGINYKVWLWKQNGFLMLPHPLTNFEIQKYYQNEPRFNGGYSRMSLP